MNRKVTRRQFLGGVGKAASAAAVFSIVPRKVLGGSAQIAPSDELTKAVIGVGDMGMHYIDQPARAPWYLPA